MTDPTRSPSNESRSTHTPTGWSLWWHGARPRTLPAAVVPVAVGAAAAVDAVGFDDVNWWKVGGALAVSLMLQVGVNYANDYSDGVRGTDDRRTGPLRLVGSGSASARSVKFAALASFGAAGLFGLALAATTSWWLLAVGVAAIAAAWGYTGGPKPYGYLGFGELFVFVFFGVVATVGTTYVAALRVPAIAWIASVGVGAVACALLVVNNLRDIPTDAVAGKRTLAVRLGDPSTRRGYLLLIAVALGVPLVCALWQPWAAIAMLSAPAAIPAVRPVRDGATGRDLIAVLGATGRFQLIYGVLFAIGLAV